MKEYKLLKDTPTRKAETVFVQRFINRMCNRYEYIPIDHDRDCYSANVYGPDKVENNPDWFEEVKEEEALPYSPYSRLVKQETKEVEGTKLRALVKIEGTKIIIEPIIPPSVKLETLYDIVDKVGKSLFTKEDMKDFAVYYVNDYTGGQFDELEAAVYKDLDFEFNKWLEKKNKPKPNNE